MATLFTNPEYRTQFWKDYHELLGQSGAPIPDTDPTAEEAADYLARASLTDSYTDMRGELAAHFSIQVPKPGETVGRPGVANITALATSPMGAATGSAAAVSATPFKLTGSSSLSARDLQSDPTVRSYDLSGHVLGFVEDSATNKVYEIHQLEQGLFIIRQALDGMLEEVAIIPAHDGGDLIHTIRSLVGKPDQNQKLASLLQAQTYYPVTDQAGYGSLEHPTLGRVNIVYEDMKSSVNISRISTIVFKREKSELLESTEQLAPLTPDQEDNTFLEHGFFLLKRRGDKPINPKRFVHTARDARERAIRTGGMIYYWDDTPALIPIYQISAGSKIPSVTLVYPKDEAWPIFKEGSSASREEMVAHLQRMTFKEMKRRTVRDPYWFFEHADAGLVIVSEESGDRQEVQGPHISLKFQKGRMSVLMKERSVEPGAAAAAHETRPRTHPDEYTFILTPSRQNGFQAGPFLVSIEDLTGFKTYTVTRLRESQKAFRKASEGVIGAITVGTNLDDGIILEEEIAWSGVYRPPAEIKSSKLRQKFRLIHRSGGMDISYGGAIFIENGVLHLKPTKRLKAALDLDDLLTAKPGDMIGWDPPVAPEAQTPAPPIPASPPVQDVAGSAPTHIIPTPAKDEPTTWFANLNAADHLAILEAEGVGRVVVVRSENGVYGIVAGDVPTLLHLNPENKDHASLLHEVLDALYEKDHANVGAGFPRPQLVSLAGGETPPLRNKNLKTLLEKEGKELLPDKMGQITEDGFVMGGEHETGWKLFGSEPRGEEIKQMSAPPVEGVGKVQTEHPEKYQFKITRIEKPAITESSKLDSQIWYKADTGEGHALVIVKTRICYIIYRADISRRMLENHLIDINELVSPWDPLESTCRHASLSIL